MPAIEKEVDAAAEKAEKETGVKLETKQRIKLGAFPAPRKLALASLHLLVAATY